MAAPRPHPPWPWRRRAFSGAAGGLLAAFGLVVALGPTVGGDAPSYGGGFEAATFHEDGLEADRAAHGLEELFGTGGVAVLHARLDRSAATWVVHDDGRVVMTGDADWPVARDAFAAWYEARGLGRPSFGDVQVTTEDSVLDDRRALLS